MSALIFSIAGLSTSLISLILLISSLAFPNWATIDQTDLGILTCSDCADSQQSWSWECYAKYYCDLQKFQDYCDAFKAGFQATYLFLCLEGVALIMNILMIEKWVIFLMRKDYGHPVLFYLFSSMTFLFHTLATGVWIFVSQGVFSDCDDGSDPDVCIKEGPYLAISNVFITLGAAVLSTYVVYKASQEQLVKQIMDDYMLCLPKKLWMALLGAFYFVSFILILTAGVVQEWVENQSSGVDFEGSLMNCSDCHQEIENFGYNCLRGKQCDQDQDSGLCEVYQNLSSAGWNYIAIQLVSIQIFILLMQVLTAFIGGREYGIVALNYSYAVLFGLFQIVATLQWFLITGASVSQECDENLEESDDEVPLCTTVGPALQISIAVLTNLLSGGFCFLYRNRGFFIQTIEVEVSMESEADKPISTPQQTSEMQVPLPSFRDFED